MLYKALSDAKAQHPPMIFVDAPLLFEGGIDGLCDCTAAVLAPENVRLERICLRDGITEAEARARMANQHGDAYFPRAVWMSSSTAPLPPGEIPEKALSWPAGAGRRCAMDAKPLCAAAGESGARKRVLCALLAVVLVVVVGSFGVRFAKQKLDYALYPRTYAQQVETAGAGGPAWTRISCSR